MCQCVPMLRSTLSVFQRCPGWVRRNAFLSKFLQDYYKNLEDNALFLQNLARYYKKIPILEDSGRLGVSCKIITRSSKVSEVWIFQKLSSAKLLLLKPLLSRNLKRIAKKPDFLSSPKNHQIWLRTWSIKLKQSAIFRENMPMLWKIEIIFAFVVYSSAPVEWVFLKYKKLSHDDRLWLEEKNIEHLLFLSNLFHQIFNFVQKLIEFWSETS